MVTCVGKKPDNNEITYTVLQATIRSNSFKIIYKILEVNAGNKHIIMLKFIICCVPNNHFTR